MRMPATTARFIFDSALEAVLPPAMVRGHLRRHRDSLVIGQKSYKLTKNVYVVGFGKAVTGMYRAVQDELGDHIVKGILSVPTGTRMTLTNANKRFLLPEDDGKTVMCEGALNNLPDERSHETTRKIENMLHGLTDQDILLTLISGGGSALLCSPIPPLTVKEKTELTTLLAKQGATIQELNTVRKHLSQVKGGGLAKAAFPAQVACLILSDIIGDPLGLIASGPTVPNNDKTGRSIEILRKFNVQDKVPSHVIDILEASDRDGCVRDFNHVQNILVGTNSIAVKAAVKEAKNHGYDTFVLSNQISGEAKDVGVFFIDLAKHIWESRMEFQNSIQNINKGQLGQSLYMKFAWKSCIKMMLQDLSKLPKIPKKLCIIGAGETTVTVKGNGKGGRNQEMVLSAAIQYFRHSASAFVDGIQLTFLSAGTDGQDGPTDAAGAVFDNDRNPLIRNEPECSEAQKSLVDNDSYHFLKERAGNILTTGVTGTNVMDIQILTMELSS